MYVRLFLKCGHKTLISKDQDSQYPIGEYTFCVKCGHRVIIVNKEEK